MINTNEDLVVIDVREESEYCNDRHIPGALLYPWSSGILQDSYGELPYNRDILVVCRIGNRSMPAADFLCTHGFTFVYNMTGGMVNWQWEKVGCVDSDSDGVNDDVDNCPGEHNPRQDDEDCDSIGDTCDASIDCTAGIDCDSDCDSVSNQNDNCPYHYNPGQEDTYPPQGNGMGNACECESNFDCDQDVDAADITAFLAHFGRSQYNRPCTNQDQCHGDFSCDRDVDAADVTKFLEDFGRSQYNKPCPQRVAGDWCIYP